MNHYLFISLFLYIFAASGRSQATDDCEDIQINDNDVHSFGSVSPYDQSLCQKIHTAMGHKLEITVKTIEIDGTEPLFDHLLIKPGLHLNDPGDGKVFTHVLNKERSYVLFSNTAFIQFNAHPDSNNNINPNKKKGFQMTYRRIGEETITTTTEAPNPNPLPTPSGGDTIYLTVYLNGKRLFEYTPVFIEKLRMVIIEMAKSYCEFAGIPMDTEPGLNTHENVLIHSLMDCPWNWEDRDHCASMEFSLPLHMQADYEGYQLDRIHMGNMWHHFGAQNLGTIGLQNYEKPDAEESANIGVIVMASITIAFIIILGLFTCLIGSMKKFKGASKLVSESNDERSSIGHIQRLSRPSWSYDDDDDDNLHPDPYQTFPQPPTFEDDDSKDYMTYDNHSIPKPESNRVISLDPSEYEISFTTDSFT